jgi:hypothetical protein
VSCFDCFGYLCIDYDIGGNVTGVNITSPTGDVMTVIDCYPSTSDDIIVSSISFSIPRCNPTSWASMPLRLKWETIQEPAGFPHLAGTLIRFGEGVWSGDGVKTDAVTFVCVDGVPTLNPSVTAGKKTTAAPFYAPSADTDPVGPYASSLDPFVLFFRVPRGWFPPGYAAGIPSTAPILVKVWSTEPIMISSRSGSRSIGGAPATGGGSG